MGEERQGLFGDFFYGSVTMGERGQVVIPADARKAFGLEPGNKLLVFRHPHHPGLVLTRVDDIQALLTQLQRITDMLSRLTRGASKSGVTESNNPGVEGRECR